ncbi:hypothetical protein ACW9UR_07085 [Halovulum sp. GXIMD14794]
MSWEAVAAVAGAISGFSALVGVVGQHFWTKTQIRASTSHSNFLASVDSPVTNLISSIDDYEALVNDYMNERNNADCDKVKSEGFRVNRRINSAINKAARFDKAYQDTWFGIDTSTFEGHLDVISDATRNLHAAGISRELGALRGGLENAMETARPK